MPNSRLVSIIIIFFNSEQFLQSAIDSALAQTYNHWELLLVDDGSMDNSTAIALEYTAAYPERIRYLEHPNHQNRGTSATRNLGLDYARGDFIAFLDADDIWPTHKLEHQVAILECHPEVAMTYGRIHFWYSWSGKSEDRQRDHFQELGVPPNSIIEPPQLLVNLIKRQYQQFGMPNVMIRKTVIDQVGRFEEQFRSMGEDYILFIKIAANFPIFVSEEYWLKCRQHDGSTSRTTAKSENKFAFQMLVWVEQYLNQQNIKDEKIWQAMQNTKFFYSHPFLYFFLRGYLHYLMLAGRYILPTFLRHWLWIWVGSRLYGAKVKI